MQGRKSLEQLRWRAVGCWTLHRVEKALDAGRQMRLHRAQMPSKAIAVIHGAIIRRYELCTAIMGRLRLAERFCECVETAQQGQHDGITILTVRCIIRQALWTNALGPQMYSDPALQTRKRL